MTITILSNDGTARNEIDVEAYGPVGTSLFQSAQFLSWSLAESLTCTTMHYYEEEQAATEKALREEAMQNAAVRS